MQTMAIAPVPFSIGKQGVIRISYLQMKTRSDRLKALTARRSVAPLVILALTVVVALLIFGRRQDEIVGGSSAPAASLSQRTHELRETSEARFISVIIYDAKGEVSSYMVGAGTDEFDAFAKALAEARPVPDPADDTFSNLLVVSFGRSDTMDLSYSPKKNLVILGEQTFQPAADLGPLVTQVSQKFNY